MIAAERLICTGFCSFQGQNAIQITLEPEEDSMCWKFASSLAGWLLLQRWLFI